MRYRIGLYLCAGIMLALGAALFGPTPAGLASDEDQDRTIGKPPAGAMCRTMLSPHHVTSPSIVSYWLFGRADLGSNAWLENWASQFGLPRAGVAPPAAANSLRPVPSNQSGRCRCCVGPVTNRLQPSV
jgi:hypothetical protein